MGGWRVHNPCQYGGRGHPKVTEWTLSCMQLVQDDTKRVDVSFGRTNHTAGWGRHERSEQFGSFVEETWKRIGIESKDTSLFT